jgi:hypothetical protein
MGLTRLELSWEALAGDTTYVTSSKLPFISTLTALQDLCICPGLPFERDSLRSPYATVFTASMFAPLSRLTSLRLFCKDTKMNAKFEPQALRDKTSLQHLALPCIWFAVRGEGDVPAVFAELHQLQELTYLNLHGTFREKPDDAILPAAACTSLAASSKLQHLDISCNFFPLGLWQELFNPNRRLQQLRVLDIGETNVEYDNVDSNLLLTAADAQRLASCCPGLQQLSAYGTLRGADAVAALSPLSCSLRTLLLGRTGVPWAKLRSVPQMGWAQALAQLTSLEELDATIEVPWGKLECDMQYLTNLRCLTRLEIWNCSCNGLVLKHQVRKHFDVELPHMLCYACHKHAFVCTTWCAS